MANTLVEDEWQLDLVQPIDIVQEGGLDDIRIWEDLDSRQNFLREEESDVQGVIAFETLDPEETIEGATSEVVLSTPVSELEAAVCQEKLVETLLPSMSHVETLRRSLNTM